MKKILLVLSFLLVTGCTYVPPGNVGILVDLLGSDKGVSAKTVGVGRYWLGLNEKLYLFPTFTQNQVWTQKKDEGSPNDDSIDFDSKQGLPINTDIGVSYSLEPEKISILFQTYRKGIDDITHTYMRTIIRDAFVRIAATRDIEDIYGAGKGQIIKAVEDDVKKQVEPIGIKIDRIYFIGRFRLPKPVEDAINNKMVSGQMTAQREAELQQTIAIANKTREEARGEADAALIRAQAEAQSITVRGKALQDNPGVIQLNAIEKWNGILPQSTGGAMPFINLK